MMSAAVQSAQTSESRYGSPMTGLNDEHQNDHHDNGEDQARYLYAKYISLLFML